LGRARKYPASQNSSTSVLLDYSTGEESGRGERESYDIYVLVGNYINFDPMTSAYFFLFPADPTSWRSPSNNQRPIRAAPSRLLRTHIVCCLVPFLAQTHDIPYSFMFPTLTRINVTMF
jgi:hypothetical protein